MATCSIPSGLHITTSPIHGLGVFATSRLPANKSLGEFLGQRMTLKEFRAQYGKDIRYCLTLGRANAIVVSKKNRNWMTYINEAPTPDKINVVFRRRKLYPIRDIEVGEELLLRYGKSYPREEWQPSTEPTA